MGSRDLRYALRSLRKSPGFVVIAILALGAGLGLSTTMFAVMDAVLHPYTALKDPERLTSITWRFGARSPLSPAELYRYVRDNARSYQALVPVSEVVALLEAGGDLREMLGSRVSSRWFAVTGVRPRLGRAFTASESGDAAILGDRLWRTLHGARRSLDGASVQVNHRTYRVVGVLPRGAGAELLLPLPAGVDEGTVSGEAVTLLGRLKPGVTIVDADHELKAMARLLTDRYGTHAAPFGFNLAPLEARREELRDLHKAMVGAALAVLLIACQNLANLMLARGLARRREVALRLALGASRPAVVWQMFLESGLVTVAGAAAGALVAVWGSFLLGHRMPTEIQWVGLVEPQLSWRVFAASSLLAAISAVLFGLLPTIRVVRGVSLEEPLKADAGTTTGRGHQRFNALVAIEVAVTLVLLMGGGLLLRTVRELQREPPGLDSRSVFRADITAQPILDTVARFARRERVLTQVAAMPEVRDVASSGNQGVPGAAITAEMTGASTHLITMGGYPAVTPTYLKVLGLPILEGRDFELGDLSGPGVAIIDSVAARRLYPAQDPIGRMLKLGGAGSNGAWVRIVGVVRSPYVLEASSRYAPEPAVFVVRSGASPFGQLLIRVKSREPHALVSLQARLHELRDVSVGTLKPWDEARSQDLVSRGFLADVFVAMGVVALALAALGLYGVLAFAVSQRMREFAVRVALGADPGQLRRMVLQDAGAMLLAGIGGGAFVALAAGRMLDAVLVTIQPWDVRSLLLSEALLLAVGLLAALVPAHHAARADPVAILRVT